MDASIVALLDEMGMFEGSGLPLAMRVPGE
jgi:hypothetical protein